MVHSLQKVTGEPHVVEDPDVEIPTLYKNLNVQDDKFTIDEFRKVKSSLMLGKAAGLDELPPSHVILTRYVSTSASEDS